MLPSYGTMAPCAVAVLKKSEGCTGPDVIEWISLYIIDLENEKLI